MSTYFRAENFIQLKTSVLGDAIRAYILNPFGVYEIICYNVPDHICTNPNGSIPSGYLNNLLKPIYLDEYDRMSKNNLVEYVEDIVSFNSLEKKASILYNDQMIITLRNYFAQQALWYFNAHANEYIEALQNAKPGELIISVEDVIPKYVSNKILLKLLKISLEKCPKADTFNRSIINTATVARRRGSLIIKFVV